MAKIKSGIFDNLKLTPVSRFFSLLSVDRKEIFYIYIYALFNGMILLSLPLGIQAIINLISGGQITSSWIILVIIVIMGTAFAGIMQIIQVSITERIQQNIFTRSAFEFAYRIPRFKMEALNNRYAPELVNRFFDTLSVQKGLSKILIDFSTATLQILFGLILLSFYNPFFIIFSITFILIVYIIFRFTGPPGLRASIRESKYKYEVVHWLEELGRTMPTFKLAGIPTLPMNRTNELVSNYLSARKTHFRLLLIQYGSLVFFKVIVTASLLILGGILVINQQMNIGQFVASEIIIIMILNSVEKLIFSMETIYDVFTAAEKIGDVTDLELEREGGISIKDNQKGLSVFVENLTYKAPVTEKVVLNNISFNIQPGEKVCISGFNGSGKTTLVNILSGLYENFSGNILYNDIPFSNIDINNLRSRIGDNLSQEDVFYGTIRENITIGRDDIKDEEIINAINHAGLSQFIRGLPYGLETTIGSEGNFLPGSIVKKIILARSFAEKPMLMVVEDDFVQFQKDEKQRIINYLTDKNKQWTLLIISNDKLVANSCQRIIALKDGKLIGDDTPSALQNESWFDEVFL